LIHGNRDSIDGERLKAVVGLDREEDRVHERHGECAVNDDLRLAAG
jgi:hypothetical protein